MEVGLLGPFRVLDADGVPVEVAGGRQRSVLVLLALHPATPVASDRLIDELWPGPAPRDPANAVQVAVSKVRRALGEERILTRPGGYELAVEAAAVDGFRAEALAAQAREAMRLGRTTEALVAIDEALALWRGEPLAEFSDLPSAASAATAWRELRDGLREDRFELLLGFGRSAELVAELEVAVEAAPYRERLIGLLMLALYRAGRQADALEVHAAARRRLADDLGLEPGPELRDLEASVLCHDPALAAPPAPAGGRTNLRPTRTSLVGRDADLAALGAALGRSRLVTLVGPGGVGKTQLATACAEGLLRRRGESVWFVSLEGAVDQAGIVEATAAAIGLPAPGAGEEPDARVRETFCLGPTLLLLDNCEHVIDEAALLVDAWLGTAPDLRVLATSREALRVPGEVAHLVLPLDGSDAVALFIERARAVNPAFDAADVDHELAGLCARLDGLPLAIELVAARMNAFTVAQAVAGIEAGGDEVTISARTASPRQRSLAAITAWSHDLLDDGERLAFERLGVCAGPCPLDAVLAVTDADAATLGRLVDQSLVATDQGRFRLLFTLRAFARDRLSERPDDLVRTRDRHLAHFGALASTAAHDWRRPDGRPQAAWLDDLHAQEDDLVAALDWSVERGDAESALRLAGDLGWYWWRSGQTRRGAERLNLALAGAGQAGPEVTAVAAAWRVWLAFDAGDVVAATAHCDEALELNQRHGRPVEHAMLHVAAAQVAWTNGDPEVALAHYDASVALSGTQPDPWNTGIGRCVAAMADGVRGDISKAEAAVRESVDLLATVGDTAGRLTSMTLLAAFQERRGDLDRATKTLAEARALSDGRWFRAQAATTSIRLGAVALVRGRPADALRHYGDALAMSQEIAVPRSAALALIGMAEAHRARGDTPGAEEAEDALAGLVARHGEAITVPLGPFGPA